jgi:PleD family two-component response regulator
MSRRRGGSTRAARPDGHHRNHIGQKWNQERVYALARQARTDSLTGLPNRRHFDETLAREWRRGLRAQTPLGLLMIDADHFKSYKSTA